MRIALLATLALLLALAGPAPAASPPFRAFPLGGGSGETPLPETDGLRYVAINAAPGVVRVFDTHTKISRDVLVRPECTMRAVTVNVALVGCTGDARAYLLRLRTGAISVLGSDSGGRSDFSWFAIGRHWMAGGYHENRPVTVYVNWRTGRGGGSFDGFEGPPHDLDAPELTPYSPSHSVFVRDPPFVLKDVFRGSGRNQRLVLDRRGGSRVVLSDCTGVCHAGRLAANLATWMEHDRYVFAYDVRSRRRIRWTIDDPESFPRFLTGHTRRYVVVTLTSRKPPYERRLLWARVRP